MGSECQRSAAVVIGLLVAELEALATAGMVPVEALRAVAARYTKSDQLASHYDATEANCRMVMTEEQVVSQRRNLLGRVIVKTFAHLLDDPSVAISRRHVPRLFQAIRMMLGEDVHAELQQQCRALWTQINKRSSPLAWNDFYGHANIAAVLDTVQVSIADSFRRFDKRLDWLTVVMNTDQAKAVRAGDGGGRASDSSGSGLTRADLLLLLRQLLDSKDPHRMGDAEKAAFITQWGAPAEVVFGPIFARLGEQRPPVSAPRRSSPDGEALRIGA